MNLIKLTNINKSYPLGKKDRIYVLKHISLEFPPSGLISIVGKSGSGKSTLLNILAGLDNFDSGTYIFASKNVNEFTNKEKRIFLNGRIGIIFQHYHLLEDHTALENIILPMIIHGASYDNAKNDALILSNALGFPNELLLKKVSELSGGEKQRVAILRSLINSPNVIFCDEPTGALDSKNSINVMELLKKASKTKLVIVVSHNKELISKYSDRIIELKDGKIIDDKTISINKIQPKIVNENVFFIKSHKWIDKFTLFNLKKRKKRNIFLTIISSISLLATTLIISFIYGSKISIYNEGYKHIDYGSLTIFKEVKSSLNNTFISLVEESRPSIIQLEQLSLLNPNNIITNNYDILLPSFSDVYYGENKLEDLLIKPVYNYSLDYLDYDLFIEYQNISNNFNEIFINKKAYFYLENLLKVNPIGQILSIKFLYESTYYTFDNLNTVITDTYFLDKEFKIVGVVDELDFLSSPTIYYNYQEFISYLDNYYLNNLSTYLGEYISWKSRIDEASDKEELSSYSSRIFIKEKDYKNIAHIISQIESVGLKSSSLSLTINESLSSLILASSTGMSIFLIVSIIGVILIFGILSFFSFNQDRHQNAILSALGVSRNNLTEIYLTENLLVSISGYFISMGLAFPFIYLFNFILEKITHLPNLLKFPTSLLINFKLDYVFISLLILLIITYLSTSIPILASKRISIIKELKDE